MRGALLLVVSLVTGCGAPIQYRGAIPIDHAGLGARLQALCGLEMGAAACHAASPSAADDEG